MANRLANLSPLRIVPFTNPSGQIAVRVAGVLHGKRIRKNFSGPTANYRAQMFLNGLVGVRGQRPAVPVATFLTEAEVRHAEAAYNRLPPGATLGQAVEFFAEHHRPLMPLPLFDGEQERGAIAAFGHWLDVQRKCELVTIEQREGLLRHFARDTGAGRTDQITLARAERWIYAPRLSARTQRDRFDVLNLFCGWLVKKSHAAANPVAELDRPVHKARVPAVLSFDEVWRLLHEALIDGEGPDMLPYFAVCALSGVRPDEAQRLTWADVYLEPEHRLIEVNKAKGGRTRRNVPISDPLWRILTWARERGFPPAGFSRFKFERIRAKARLRGVWEKDVLRHTYASHEYVRTKDIRTLSQDMGNSERVLFQHYIRPVPLADAERFRGLVLHWSTPPRPPRTGGVNRKKKTAAPEGSGG